MSKKHDDYSRHSSISVSRSEITDVEEDKQKYKNMARKLKERLADSEIKIKNYKLKIDELTTELDKKSGGKDRQEENREVNLNLKRLESTIVSLQTKLIKESENHAKVLKEIEENHTKVLREKEDENKKVLKDLEDTLNKLRESSSKDRTVLENIYKNFSNEKELLKKTLREEAEQEVNRIVSEKMALSSLLQGAKEQLEKQRVNLEKQKEEAIVNLKTDMTSQKTEYETKFREIHEACVAKIEEIKASYEGKIFEINRSHKEIMEKQSTAFEHKIGILTSNSSKKNESLLLTSQKEIENLRSLISKLKEQLEKAKTESDPILEQHKAEFKRVLELTKNEYKTVLDAKEGALKELKLLYDKTTGELEDTVTNLKSQINQAKDNIKRLHESGAHLQGQHNASLIKQKEAYDKEIHEKDSCIATLERSLKKIAEESIDRINSMERKNALNTEDIKELTAKLVNTKAELEKTEKIVWEYKNEIARLKDVLEKNSEFNKNVYIEKQTLEKKIHNLESDVRNKEQEIVKIKAELGRYMQGETLIREDKNRVNKELNALREEIALKKKDNEILNASLNTLNDDVNKMRMQFPEEVKMKVNNVCIEKDKVISELTGKICILENMVKSQQEARVRNEGVLSNFMNEKEKNKHAFDTMKFDYDRKLAELMETQKKLNALEAQFLSNMKEISNREQELVVLRQKVKEIDAKDIQIVNLNTQLNSVQHTYTHTLNRLTDDHKKEREELVMLRKKVAENTEQIAELSFAKASIESVKENCRTSIIRNDEMHAKETKKLNDKIKELEMKSLFHEQRIEQLKLDNLKELNNAKKLPPEDEKKFMELKKEYEDLSMRYSLTEQRLDKTLLEHAGTQAGLKAKEEFLKDKEEELKKYENSLRNAPPRLLDPAFKTGRDEALAKLRQKTIEYNKLVEDVQSLKEKLRTAEDVVKEIQKEKREQEIMFNETKQSLLQALNEKQNELTKK
jgi:chromosome segregation ATPase